MVPVVSVVPLQMEPEVPEAWAVRQLLTLHHHLQSAVLAEMVALQQMAMAVRRVLAVAQHRSLH